MLQTEISDTIYAPSSAIGGAIAVLRISGPASRDVAKAILDRDITKHPRELRHALVKDGDRIADDCMAVFLPAPHTYTGEDMVELHCHGGMQTVREVLACIGATGARPAVGGDFTKRAFLNGKMDLSQAEAVMDVINSTAEGSLKAALRQLHGSVSRTVHSVEELLLDTRSSIEAAIDYPDEAEEDFYAELPSSLEEAIQLTERLLREGRRNRVLRDGLQVVILGRPNVGKSSLMNAILGEDRAIVTSVAGTTRDLIDERISLGGVPIRLVDTAGLRDASDEAESIGIERAHRAMEQADLLLLVFDGSVSMNEEETALWKATEGKARICVANKADLGTVVPCDIAVSCKNGTGIDALKERIASVAAPNNTDESCITNVRHLDALEMALRSLQHAKAVRELDCIATDLREALHHLGAITGTDVDAEVIDRVFSNFCVGK